MIENKNKGGGVVLQAPTSVMKLDKVVKETQNKKVSVPKATIVKVGDKTRQVSIKNKPLNHNHTMKYAQNKEVFLSNFDLLKGRKSPTTPPIFTKAYSCDDHEEENIMIITIYFTKIRKLMRKMIKHGTEDMPQDLEKCIDICYKKKN